MKLIGPSFLSPISLSTGIGLIGGLFVAYFVTNAIHSATLHPLAAYPGPFWPSVSRIPWWIILVTGEQVAWMQKLHDKYSPVVRFSPNDLSFLDVQDGDPKEWLFKPFNGVASMLAAVQSEHHRLRRIFAPAFSQQALKKKEPIIKRHSDVLITTLDKLVASDPEEPVDMLRYSPWLDAIFDTVEIAPAIQVIQYYPWIDSLLEFLQPKSIYDLKRNHFRYTANRMGKRLERGPAEHPDIWSMALASENGKESIWDEMHSNSELFLLAGSETAATLLSGKLQLLVKEVRSSFKTAEDVDMESCAGLKYLNACTSPAHVPPPRSGIPRLVPAGGRTILGRYVPAGTSVSIPHFATYNSFLNFTNSTSRWRPNIQNGHGKKAFKPFAYGPRDCVGQNLALYEMRLVLVRVLLRFDLELCEESKDWRRQKVYGLWEKKPLLCRLTPVVTTSV
ncbi:cytochrome P450 [Podospora didyma]|uniref:Cytochrome P450 n=1 Tax=Podospora didyma TaxID=330526 RepID=A0AAE0NZW7_9PEZI|nr:cytochrome P450 [Podospora didyma]